MNELIESYERKLKAIQPMIESAKFDEDTEREIRLRTKASCYRTFLNELKQQCNIANVVGRSEQLKAFLDYVDSRYSEQGTRDKIVDEFLSL
jgi:hypothetical protein